MFYCLKINHLQISAYLLRFGELWRIDSDKLMICAKAGFGARA